MFEQTEGPRLDVKSKPGLQYLADICACLQEACVGFGGSVGPFCPQHCQNGACKEERTLLPPNSILLLLGATAWWWEWALRPAWPLLLFAE